MVMNKYEVVKYGDKYTIAVYDERYDALIINDRIYGYYKWNQLEDAKKACDLFNDYEYESFLYQHQPIFDDELDDYDLGLVQLYDAFGMICDSENAMCVL